MHYCLVLRNLFTVIDFIFLQEELGIEYDEDVGVSLQSFSDLLQRGKKQKGGFSGPLQHGKKQKGGQ